jgi:hypothetical protein
LAAEEGWKWTIPAYNVSFVLNRNELNSILCRANYGLSGTHRKVASRSW